MFVSNSTIKSDGELCFKDTSFNRTTVPQILNITCIVHGQYVIYYNERLPNKTYPSYYSSFAHNELCEVEVHGKSHIQWVFILSVIAIFLCILVFEELLYCNWFFFWFYIRFKICFLFCLIYFWLFGFVLFCMIHFISNGGVIIRKVQILITQLIHFVYLLIYLLKMCLHLSNQTICSYLHKFCSFCLFFLKKTDRDLSFCSNYRAWNLQEPFFRQLFDCSKP